VELIGGRQPDFALAVDTRTTQTNGGTDDWRPMQRPAPLPSKLTKEETAAHTAFVESLGDDVLWKKLS